MLHVNRQASYEYPTIIVPRSPSRNGFCVAEVPLNATDASSFRPPAAKAFGGQHRAFVEAQI
jgi:hypothetical protein